MTKTNKEYIFLALITILMLFINLGLTPTNIMEARNFVTAREIIDSNNWIFTTLNGLPRYEKPPLPTWITAIFGKFFGFDNLYYLRIPVAIITVLLVFYFYHLVKRFTTHFHAYLASLILITSFYIFFAGRDNNWDMYTHSFVIIALFYLLLLYQKCYPIGYKFYLGAISSLSLAASILSKGPVSLYALYLPFLLAYFLVYKDNRKSKFLIALSITVTGTLIGFSWMWYVKTHDPLPFSKAAKTEISRWGSYNIRPFYYYWSFFTQSGIWTVVAFIALLYPYLKNKVSNPKAYQFAFLWTIFSLILLSIIPEKKTRYILPTLIPLAYNTSFYVLYLYKNFTTISNKERLAANFSFGIIGIIACLFVGIIPYLILQKSFSFYAIPLVLSGLFFGWTILNSLKSRNFMLVFYSTILLMTSVVAFAYPVFTSKLNNPKYTSRENFHEIEKQWNIKTYESDGFIPELILAYGEPIPVIKNLDEITLPKSDRFGVLLDVNDTIFMDSVLFGYHHQKITTLDFNRVHPNTPFYNPRLTRAYYLVEKK
ncbi:ArnT family glycosyltransferase [Weeksella virosa]|uniref:ArnT-like undecaprenyl-phosphate alpha-4-amino-4-deoxy-L-arabinose arabinosyl transferase n=1 Tax=Weeksella virosa (strain ATCC 43766 / DSM 16922 / JCM 21250 / CCUG 30538 / CDC 9751 / IAM 14551 / NBRC 16016 / NCTC 11634 / CL345/78) TaxID=865938 RepID=F0P1X6_WEEVC|nr:glycosyltransferase family 39 protein [Weeksella virosa]ADX67686.1 ArnT-like undecaprenyl-phosphate alpha-4-amino-4-deoxy-L-arabinose arabinosyl transferase [Weeksella virosa DSM 16922]VEH64687.1 Undecaprenyl phosphate-alpha-4-amino-4-deoxy-L-arabinose arabinosyl transferase [Weeksella virosa]